MFTQNLKKIVTRRKKRVGRGYGSGKGAHTVGRGSKGQTSRAGHSIPKGFEGGQNTLIRRLPKLKGIKSLREKSVSVNIINLLKKNIFEIDAAVLSSFAKSNDIKLVGSSSYEGYDLSKVVVKNGIKLTKTLREKITQSGGKVEE